MLTLMIYSKDHKRKPVRIGPYPFFRDTQAQIPLAWCSICGSEVFEYGQHRCIHCRQRKGEPYHG